MKETYGGQMRVCDKALLLLRVFAVCMYASWAIARRLWMVLDLFRSTGNRVCYYNLGNGT